MEALFFFFEDVAVSVSLAEGSAMSEVVSALLPISLSVSFPVEEPKVLFPAAAFCAAVRCPVVFEALF